MLEKQLDELRLQRESIAKQLQDIDDRIGAIARVIELTRELDVIKSKYPDLIQNTDKLTCSSHYAQVKANTTKSDTLDTTDGQVSSSIDLPIDLNKIPDFLLLPSDIQSSNVDDEWGSGVMMSVSAIAQDNDGETKTHSSTQSTYLSETMQLTCLSSTNEQTKTTEDKSIESEDDDDEWGKSVMLSTSQVAMDRSDENSTDTNATTSLNAKTSIRSNKPPFTSEELNYEYVPDTKYKFSEELNHGDKVLHVPSGAVGVVFAPSDRETMNHHNKQTGKVVISFKDRLLPLPVNECTKNLEYKILDGDGKTTPF